VSIGGGICRSISGGGGAGRRIGGRVGWGIGRNGCGSPGSSRGGRDNGTALNLVVAVTYRFAVDRVPLEVVRTAADAARADALAPCPGTKAGGRVPAEQEHDVACGVGNVEGDLPV
jgi:hypothetical protein